MNAKNPLFVSIISLVLLTALTAGCNKAPAPAPTVPLNGAQPIDNVGNVAKIAYIGDNACKQCHPQPFETVPKTKHFSAFKPLSDYPLDKPLTSITIFDAVNTEKPTSTTLDLSKAKVYGVMVDKYIIAEIPAAGFKEKIYRVGALKKTDDKWTVEAPKENDIDKDGKPDWTAEKFTCGKCHAPGLENSSDNLSISCESCHGPAGNHASATDKKGTLSRETARTSCMNCHKSDPAKDAQGNFTANNHYGTRDFFASKHAQSSQLNGCQTCHNPHKANANGATLVADKPTEICAKCHAGINFDLDKLMWKNPTDPQGHFTKDHSFGAIKYEDLQDDPATKPVEIKNPTVIELIKKLLPELAK
ncbi:cytochrome c3 family protein [Desulfosporosinus sp. BICA1-9]|uniref:cytochrome c3 family protein n=1 Tax=Desulfosporosinus sp. BICA1-9 TaxID=1531958 RepID=UPI00054BF6AD|nr:cytochrome c3 family protein [Desulfosporosinus sp. BICA1-9]KJS47546.1 MAG: hypothetical protein VR66_19080 [Peptococcaceae bacterium BRH_c23]KJS89229.1 MAG: hypothetical protein JL57_08270 [Desulfosporosinus sp. BICA1-9]HBW35419.1 hypothetical protein [Desulfosporosinus sp.]